MISFWRIVFQHIIYSITKRDWVKLGSYQTKKVTIAYIVTDMPPEAVMPVTLT